LLRFEGDGGDAPLLFGKVAFGDVAAAPDHRTPFVLGGFQTLCAALEGAQAVERLQRVTDALRGVALEGQANEGKKAIGILGIEDFVQQAPDEPVGLLIATGCRPSGLPDSARPCRAPSAGRASPA